MNKKKAKAKTIKMLNSETDTSQLVDYDDSIEEVFQKNE